MTTVFVPGTPETQMSRGEGKMPKTEASPASGRLADGAVLAIDPGTSESAYVVLGPDCRPQVAEKIPNDVLLAELRQRDFSSVPHVAIEMVASYGMPVGAEVFETCVWIGRFMEALGRDVLLVKRHPVKVHHCHSSRAKDSNIIQALVDRFAPGQRNRGKGTKKAPGFFYGFSHDVWQAFALGVYVADTKSVD